MPPLPLTGLATVSSLSTDTLARLLLSCLDLTSLNDADQAADIEALCARAQSPFGTVAAVCIWPRWVALARSRLPMGIAVAAVVNFPHGGSDVQAALREVGQIIDAGGDEVDVVLPWRTLLAGDALRAADLLAQVRRACTGRRLKVILETGELPNEAAIRQASAMALDAGADFLKTSTGKTPVGVTPAAARVLLSAIAERRADAVGFKASGGIRTVADAAVYVEACREVLGPQALHPDRLRFGASGLLNDIAHVLRGEGGASSLPSTTPSAY